MADQGYGYDFPLHDAAVYKFTPSGLRSTVASENDQVPVIPSGLAIDGADNLFVSEYRGGSGNTLKFTPSGVREIFAAGLVPAMAFLRIAMVSQPAPTDFNNDGKPDYLLYNPSTGHTAIWYFNNNVLIGGASGPTVRWVGIVAGVADFNLTAIQTTCCSTQRRAPR